MLKGPANRDRRSLDSAILVPSRMLGKQQNLCMRDMADGMAILLAHLHLLSSTL
jgi:hypothetical protein